MTTHIEMYHDRFDLWSAGSLQLNRRNNVNWQIVVYFFVLVIQLSIIHCINSPSV